LPVSRGDSNALVRVASHLLPARALAKLGLPFEFCSRSAHPRSRVISGWLGGGETGFKWAYLLMLIPMLAAASLAIPARHTYLRDVATAAASARAGCPLVLTPGLSA
jgi:hypothetical protein